jgi:hypothetical protein
MTATKSMRFLLNSSAAKIALFASASCCVAVVPTASAAGAVSVGTFIGKTSQGKPILIHVGHLRGVPRSFWIERPSEVTFVVACGSGQRFTSTAALFGVLNPLNGFWLGNGQQTKRLPAGRRAHERMSAQVTIDGRVARGSVTVAATLVTASGNVVGRCPSRKVSFTATRQ